MQMTFTLKNFCLLTYNIMMNSQIKIQEKNEANQILTNLLRSGLISSETSNNEREEVLPNQNRKLNGTFKWNLDQHAKYIHFLEQNRLKIKSKLIRKSNAFFKEMEKYINTKTALQCRSHHQKFEERYKFPHRIITGQKKHIPSKTYQQIVQETKNIGYQFNPSRSYYGFESPLVSQQNSASINKKSVQVECQTDLCDLRKNITISDEKEQKNGEYKFGRIDSSFYPFLQPAIQYFSHYNMLF